MTPRIVVLGSLNMDLVVRVAHLPRPGETVSGHSFFQTPGGKGANQATAAAKLGASVEMVGLAGGDAYGEAMLESLTRCGVGNRYVTRMPGGSSGLAFIFVDDRGENVIVLEPGANGHFSPSHVQPAEAVIGEAGALLMQLEIPVETVAAAARAARRAGVHIILNAAPAAELPADLLAMVDTLVVNEAELAVVSGSDSSPEQAARLLLKRGARSVLVTLGGRGSVLVEPASTTRMPAFNVQTVDTTAAGDTFMGGYAVALLEGRDPESCLRFASAAAAIKVTRPGAQTGMPSRREVDEFMAQAQPPL